MDVAESNNNGGGENCEFGCFIYFTLHHMLCYWGDQSRVDNLFTEVKKTYELFGRKP